MCKSRDLHRYRIRLHVKIRKRKKSVTPEKDSRNFISRGRQKENRRETGYVKRKKKRAARDRQKERITTKYFRLSSFSRATYFNTIAFRHNPLSFFTVKRVLSISSTKRAPRYPAVLVSRPVINAPQAMKDISFRPVSRFSAAI